MEETSALVAEYEAITSRCFINAPFDRLTTDLLHLFLTHRLRPEIGLEGSCLWQYDKEEFSRIARKLHAHGLACTLHAPFQDLSPGGVEERVVDLSRQKLRRAFELLSVFRPQTLVCHLGYESCKHAQQLERWLETATDTWSRLLPLAADQGVRVMFENTYEPDPSAHRALFECLASFFPGFCLDTGHILAFSQASWHDWITGLEPWIGQFHLHDNDGRTDSHGPIGSGIFDFNGLFSHCAQRQLRPVITLEPHREEDLWTSLAALQASAPFQSMTF